MVKIQLCMALVAALASDAGAETRSFIFEYQSTIGPIAAGEGPVHVFIPLATQSEQQHVADEQIEASIPGRIEVETTHGNRYWHGEIEQSNGEPISVRVKTTVERRTSRVRHPTTSRGLEDAERKRHSAFLEPNERVVVDHPILEPILAEVKRIAGSEDPAVVSRAIYNWVVDNVEYKKIGTGWGNGDTFWACNERYGNCTDFHALFISLARSEGIPARFEIGFSIPEGRRSGTIDGYHCWVEFYLPEVGWFPIDASEAFKHPDKREFFFGAHPGNRIHLTTGRDLQLGDGHASSPLNYFVYPHVEVDGQLWNGTIEKTFSFSDS